MKRQNDSDDSEEDDDIFHYSNKERLTFAKLQPHPKRQHVLLDDSEEESSSDDDGDSDSDSDDSDDNNKSDNEKCKEIEDCSIVGEIKQSDSTIEDLPATPPSPPPPPPDELVTVKTPPRHNSILSKLKQRLDAVHTPNSSIEIYSPIQEEETLNVKVKIHGLIKKYCIPKTKPLETLFSMIAENEKVEKRNVSLSLKSSNIQYSDTAQSLKLTIAHILDCVIIEDDGVPTEPEDVITVKIQTGNRNTKTEYKISQTSSLTNILQQFCKKFDHVFENCIFEFDAETFEPSVTPNDIGLEDGDMIDVIT